MHSFTIQRVISQGIRVAAVTGCFGTCRFSQQRELSMSARPLSELAILAELALASTPLNAMDPTVAQATGQVLSNRSSSSVNDAQRGGGSGELLGSIFGCAASGTSQTIGTIAGGRSRGFSRQPDRGIGQPVARDDPRRRLGCDGRLGSWLQAATKRPNPCRARNTGSHSHWQDPGMAEHPNQRVR